MAQTTINILTIFVLPSILGIGVRTAFFKFKKGFVVTAASAVLALIMLILMNVIDTHGDELLGILALMSLLFFVGSAVVEVTLGVVRKIKSKNNKTTAE